MGFLKRLFGVKPNNVNHDFDEEDRQQSLVLKSYQREIKRIQREIEVFTLKQQLIELKNTMSIAKNPESDEEDGMNIDKMMDRILKLAEMQKQTQIQPKDITEEEIKDIIAKTPKEYLKKAKKMPDSELLAILTKQYPQYSNSSMEKAIKMIKA